jgi:hypothetical protein
MPKDVFGKPGKFRFDSRRATVADEAARIMQEQGLNDFRVAKEKATERLGFKTNGPLPSNGEIEKALAERNRVFRGDRHFLHLRQLRESAIRLMQSLAIFHPRLVGPVLSGNATEYSTIDLHLFNDSVEAVGASLEELCINHRPTQIRHRFRRGQSERFPGYRLDCGEHEYAMTVFPELRRRNAPLSPVNGRPMAHADVREIERLLSQ